MWLFCRLSACSNMRQMKAEKAAYLDQLHPTNRHYLTKIQDEKQYPAAQCAMAQDICMYGKSASLGVESMNRAIKIVREKTAVDILNAAILLLQMEGNRYHKWKENGTPVDSKGDGTYGDGVQRRQCLQVPPYKSQGNVLALCHNLKEYRESERVPCAVAKGKLQWILFWKVHMWGDIKGRDPL